LHRTANLNLSGRIEKALTPPLVQRGVPKQSGLLGVLLDGVSDTSSPKTLNVHTLKAVLCKHCD